MRPQHQAKIPGRRKVGLPFNVVATTTRAHDSFDHYCHAVDVLQQRKEPSLMQISTPSSTMPLMRSVPLAFARNEEDNPKKRFALERELKGCDEKLLLNAKTKI